MGLGEDGFGPGLFRRLAAAFPDAPHRFHNGALGGVMSTYMNSCLKWHVPPHVDLVIVSSPPAERLTSTSLYQLEHCYGNARMSRPSLCGYLMTRLLPGSDVHVASDCSGCCLRLRSGCSPKQRCHSHSVHRVLCHRWSSTATTASSRSTARSCRASWSMAASTTRCAAATSACCASCCCCRGGRPSSCCRPSTFRPGARVPTASAHPRKFRSATAMIRAPLQVHMQNRNLSARVGRSSHLVAFNCDVLLQRQEPASG